MSDSPLQSVNKHLLKQLDRLGSDELTGDALSAEIDRAKAISGVAKDVISNASLALKAHSLALEYGKAGKAADMLTIEDKR